MSKYNHLSDTEPDFDRLYIFGAGGSGRETAWLAWQLWGERVEIRFLVDKEVYLSEPINGIAVDLLDEVTFKTSDRCVIALGEPKLRRKKVELLGPHSVAFARVVHPRVEMSPEVQLGEGAIVCAGAILTTNIVIQRHVHVNVACTISHDVTLREFTTLSPGVHISGNVDVGCGVFFGTGASVINGRPGSPLTVGDGAVVAAGACVTKPVEPGTMVAGVPAVRKR